MHEYFVSIVKASCWLLSQENSAPLVLTVFDRVEFRAAYLPRHGDLSFFLETVDVFGDRVSMDSCEVRDLFDGEVSLYGWLLLEAVHDLLGLFTVHCVSLYNNRAQHLYSLCV